MRVECISYKQEQSCELLTITVTSSTDDRKKNTWGGGSRGVPPPLHGPKFSQLFSYQKKLKKDIRNEWALPPKILCKWSCFRQSFVYSTTHFFTKNFLFERIKKLSLVALLASNIEAICSHLRLQTSPHVSTLTPSKETSPDFIAGSHSNEQNSLGK